MDFMLLRTFVLRRETLLLLVCLFGLFSSRVISADAPIQGGIAAEPFGDLKSVFVERETLFIDLRPVADYMPPEKSEGRAAIEAIYRVINRGETQEVTLNFAADTFDQGILVDDQLIESDVTALDIEKLPKGWTLPTTTLDIDRNKQLSFASKNSSSINSFKFVLTRGLHTIKVSYKVKLAANSDGSPTIKWQLGYLLFPVKHWAGFGGL
ncbi:MAG: hypothetical protein JNN15_15085, partial [Blastocatellia bacterium]|nr:hypothetical protein [Blastocatellia bacterium]